MHAEIISIGSELTTGAKLDTNSQWLSLELSGEGIPVWFHTTVADDRAANVAVLRTAVERADIVVITGGLGPTLDDLTREALAELIGVPLVLHEPSLQVIREMFARRSREMPERNVVQAMFPQGSEPIPNPRGTAPGVWLEVSRGPERPACKIAALPGVPSEMKGMFTQSVLPRLRRAGTGWVIRRARLNCFGLGESQAEEMLGDLTVRGRDPEVGITVHEATITLRIEAQAASIAECEAKIAAAKDVARARLGTAVFGEEDDELQDAVIRLLKERGLHLCTAESGTGGLLAHLLTGANGSETCFAGGIVAEGRQVPVLLTGETCSSSVSNLPNTDRGLTAELMAAACRQRFGADFALAVADCPRREAEAPGDPVPCTAIALAGPRGVESRALNLGGDPAILKSRLAKSALNLLRLYLLGVGAA